MQDTFAFDIVVVGAGVFGISTSLFLSLHYPQLRIALLEQFKIGHTEGSSHAQSRIIRSIYPIEYYRDLCLEGLSIYWP
jgi:glycine/D-amino acid oxidase-like deaminating enzyme